MSFKFYSLTKSRELFDKCGCYGVGFIDGKYNVQIQDYYVSGDKPHSHYLEVTFDEFEDAKEILKKVNSDIRVEDTICRSCGNLVFSDVSRIPCGEEYECECPKCKSLMTSRSWGFKFHSLTKSRELFNKDENYGIGFIDGKYIAQAQERFVDGDKPHTVPMGLHCYQLRHSDYGANFISLERRVGVNFGGTVITKECIDLGREQCIEFDEETEPNFLGERCQMEDFIAGDYGQEEEMEMGVTT